MSFKLSALLSLILILSIGSLQAYETEEGTNNMLLTELDFHDAIKDKTVLVNFHALWCRYSKKLKPEWAEVSKVLADYKPSVLVAKVEAYDEKKLAEEYGIEGYPTIKLFINGVAHDYNGERNKTEILEFVDRQLKRPLSEFKTDQQVQENLNKYEWVGILVGTDDAAQTAVLDVAAENGDVLFGTVTSDDIKKKYVVEDGQFVLANNIARNYVALKDALTKESISEFIQKNKFPPVARFSKGTAERIFLSDEPSILLLRKAGDAGDKAEEAFKDANADIGKNIFMSVADYEDEIGKLLVENLGVPDNELPTVRIVRADKERIRKYYLEGDISKDSIVSFYKAYKDKDSKGAKRFYLSEPEPTENNDLVKKVVTKSFEKMVLDPNTDVLLQIWAPWCGHCRAMMPVYDNVARKTREIPGFLVAKIDASVNDLEGFGLDIVEYPTILLFKRTDKENPVEFKGERNEYVFNDFIRAHASVNLDRMKGPDPFNRNEL